MMAVLSVEELYERYVRPLSPRDRLRLITMTTEELSQESAVEPKSGERSLLELEGLGAHLWKGIDAQEYVRELRSEWDDRP